MSTAELACTYAALLLHDDGQEVSAEKINAVLKAAGVTVEPYWAGLFAKTLSVQSLDKIITNVGTGGGGGGAAPAAAAGGAAPAAGKKEEKKKEEEPEEEEGDFGMSLFG